MPTIERDSRTSGEPRIPAEIRRNNTGRVADLATTARETASLEIDGDPETSGVERAKNHCPARPVRSRFHRFEQEQEEKNPMREMREFEKTDGGPEMIATPRRGDRGRGRCALGVLCAVLVALGLGAPRAMADEEPPRTITVGSFDPESRMLQLMIRFDSEHLEDYLSRILGERVIVEDPVAQRHVGSMVGAAVRLLKPDGSSRELDWVGMENETPWTYVYVQFPVPRETDGLRLRNTLFLDADPEAVNLVNLEVGEDVRTLRFAMDAQHHALTLPDAPERETTPITRSRTIGDGPIHMVLIPTNSCDWSIFEPFMRRNASRYTMHALTLPGMAGTKPPPRPLPAESSPWIDNAVDAVARFIEERGLERPVVLGHALGGVVAYRLAAEHADAVGPVITLDGIPAIMLDKNPIPPDQRRRMVEKVMQVQIENAGDAAWESNLRKLAASVLVSDERRRELVEHFLRTPPSAGKQYLIEQLKTDATWLLPKINAPTLVIGSVNNLGASQGVLAADVERYWKALFRDAPENVRLELWSETGSFITEERPERLDERVAEFLDAAL